MGDQKQAYKAPAIEKAVRIMESLAAEGEPQSLSHLSRSLGVGKSSLLGVLRGLEDAGWVERAGKGYRVGRAFAALAKSVAPSPGVVELARPMLNALAERLGQSVCLGRRSGDKVIIEACAEAAGNLRIALRPGMAVPLLAAATGMALLSKMSEAEAAALLPSRMPSYTQKSPATSELFMQGVKKAREDGFSLDEEEYMRGINAAAAPLVHEGRPMYVLWAVGFADSFPPDRLREAGRMLATTSNKLSVSAKN